MSPLQPGILADVPALARYLTFRLRPDTDPRSALARLAALHRQTGAGACVVGIGAATVRRLGASVEGLADPTAQSGPGASVPATPAALWCWLRGDDRGALLHRGRDVEAAVAEAFVIESVVDGFRYGSGRDLTGYEDGTENPTGEKALEVAAADTGASFVAVQRWVHDLDRFASFPATDRDHIIGRQIVDNEEIDDAPASAHVKRAAQESFDPEAWVLRRSMPYARGDESGLVFVAFGHSLEAFEALLRRMLGVEDGITDALFRFTRPVTSSTFWCPPVTADGALDLSALGL